MIRNPFQILGHLCDQKRPVNSPRILYHKGQEFPEYLLIEVVHRLIFPSHLIGQVAVLLHEGVEALPYHLSRNIRHPGKIDIGFQSRFFVQYHRPSGDIDRHIPDSFEVAIDLDGGSDKSQVPRGRLSQGQKTNASLLNFPVKFVNLIIARDDLIRQV